VGRIRDLLARGGIAPIAALFAIAFATVELAEAVAFIVTGAIQQHTIDSGTGRSDLEFSLFHTRFDLNYVVQAFIALLLIAALLFAIWRVGRAKLQECPECLAEVPREARICRFCTTDLPARSER